jgi:hypothetical protein
MSKMNGPVELVEPPIKPPPVDIVSSEAVKDLAAEARGPEPLLVIALSDVHLLQPKTCMVKGVMQRLYQR